MKKKDSPAEEIAFRLLARRDHSRRELRRKLLLREISSAEADRAVEKLAAGGLLDDWRYARRLALHLGREKMLGPRRIREWLVRRGVPADLLAAAEKEAEREDPAADRLRRLAEARLRGRDPGSFSRREQEKWARFFHQRGFSWEEIRDLFAKTGGKFEE